MAPPTLPRVADIFNLFITAYGVYIYPIFMLGLSALFNQKSLANGLFMFSALSLAGFFFFSNVMMLALCAGSLVFGLFSKFVMNY